MKSFTIRPFFDMRDKDWPVEALIDLPQGATLTVEQFANFVYWHIHYDPDYKTVVKRSVILATTGQQVPDNYEHVGTLIPYTESEGAEGETIEQTESDFQVPSEEEFYDTYRLINAYIAPEPTAKALLKSWSFGKDNK